MLQSKILTKCLRQLSSQSIVPNICIVGAGPAGFYAAQQILKGLNNVKVDILERLPVPYGLVRFGVAPDHPEVKNVINTFNKIAKDDRVQFFGNVNTGQDISVAELKEHYHAVLLTYGADDDKVLNIPGENLKNVVSARSFVGWYNGLPNNKNLNINLNTEDVVILGQGNVAIDIARILLSPIDKLKNTDITSHSLEQLSQSKVQRVWLVGRRGPLQAAFTIAELRELLKLDNCKTYWRPKDFEGIREIVPQLVRPRKRLTELMLKSIDDAQTETKKHNKEFHPIFFRAPVQFVGSDSIEKVKLSVTQLHGEDFLKQTAKSTDEFEEIPCGLAFRSIGYKSRPIDPSVPFDTNSGRVLNSDGKIGNGLYAAGWVATGPVGVILSTMNNAYRVGSIINKEIDFTAPKAGCEEVKKILEHRNISVISYQGWEKIDKEERQRGEKLGKPREKIVDISEMINIACS